MTVHCLILAGKNPTRHSETVPGWQDIPWVCVMSSLHEENFQVESETRPETRRWKTI